LLLGACAVLKGLEKLHTGTQLNPIIADEGRV
jgi:hypothetical protein